MPHKVPDAKKEYRGEIQEEQDLWGNITMLYWAHFGISF